MLEVDLITCLVRHAGACND